VPRVGDRIDLDEHDLTLTVETTNGRRVGKVLVERRREGGTQAPPTETPDVKAGE
jgi:hypothetical protein